MNWTSFHPRKNEYMYHFSAPVFGFGLVLGFVIIRAIVSVETPGNKQGTFMIICGKTLNKSKIYNYYSMNSSYLIIKHQLFHVVITFPYTLILYTIYCCRCSLRWVGCNTDHLCLFWIHGFQCNLQEYCPYQQKNIFDIYHCIIGCNVDNVNVSMIFGS